MAESRDTFRETAEAVFRSWDEYGEHGRAFQQQRRLERLERAREMRRTGLDGPTIQEVSNDHA